MGLTPPVTPVRAQSNRAMVTAAYSPSYNTCGAPLLSPVTSASCLISDQAPSAYTYLPTPSLELGGSNHNGRQTLPPLPSPNAALRFSGHHPPRRDGLPEDTRLHPDLVTVSCNESWLSNSGNRISNCFSFACSPAVICQSSRP